MNLRLLRPMGLLVLPVMLFLGCQQEKLDTLPNSDGVGYLQLSLGIDVDNVGGRTETVNTDSWNVIVYDAADAEVFNFADFTDVPSEIELDEGDYTVFVSSEDESVGFDNPFYTGTSGVITIVNGDVVPVTVNAELANVKVSVSYSAEVIADFTSMTTTVTSTSGSVVFGDGETRSGYFVAGEELAVSADLTFTKADLSTEIRNVTGNISSTSAKDHYLITVEYFLEEGTISPLGISVDEATNDVSVTISERPNFSATYGGSGNDRANGVIVLDDGYLIAGQSPSSDQDISAGLGGNDGWVVRTDNAGNILWETSYGGTGNDFLNEIIETSDGGFLAVGSTSSSDIPNHHSLTDAWILKIDNTGILEWQTAIGGSSIDEFYDVAETNDGDFVISGLTRSSDGDIAINQGSDDFLVVKIDALGSVIWARTFGSPTSDISRGMSLAPDGGAYVGGFIYGDGGDVTGFQGGIDFWAIKVDASGNLVWQRSMGGPSSELNGGVATANDGGMVLIGNTSGSGGDVSNHYGSSDIWIVKLDASGVLVWERNLGGANADTGNDIIATNDGGLAIIGGSRSSDNDVTSNQGDYDMWIVKLDASGVITWESSFGGALAEFGNALAESPSGGFVATGYSNSSDGDVPSNYGSGDYWLVVVDELGNL